VADDVEIDVELLKREIKKTYASVSDEPERAFIFPTGRAWAEELDYPPELANVPDGAVESFAGVANHWALGRLEPGERVLDLGSGAGTDSLIAAQMVGERGRVTGIDMTPQMLAKARSAAAAMGAANVEFVEAEAERLPFADGSFDVVISNGVIDLIPDRTLSSRSSTACSSPAGASRSPTSRSRPRSATRAGAGSTSGPAESPERCWMQRTPDSWSATASSGSRPAGSSTPTRARRSRTHAARRASTAPAGRPSRPTSRPGDGRSGVRHADEHEALVASLDDLLRDLPTPAA
jgi:arsenite methyltransferase